MGRPIYRASLSTCGCPRSSMLGSTHTRGRDGELTLSGCRTEEAIVVATGAPREAGCPPWVVLGVKAIEAPGVRAA